MQRMKAIQYTKFGSPEVLLLKDLPIPKVKDDQVLVKIKSTSINPVDFKVRKGIAKPFSKVMLPVIPGGDFSGTVEEIGMGVNEFSVGQEVYGLTPAVRGGAYAEYAAIHKEHLWYKPEKLSFDESASIPLAGLTAFQSLYYAGKMQNGLNVFINGCTGGVGSFAVQIAKAYKCEVTGVCSSGNSEYASSLGVDYVIPYDTSDPLTHSKKYDIFLDASGNYSFKKIKHLLSKKGKYINLLPSALHFLDTFLNKKVETFWVKSNKKDLEILKDMADEGFLKPHLHRIYPLQETVKAHEYFENNSIQGKVVIKIQD